MANVWFEFESGNVQEFLDLLKNFGTVTEVEAEERRLVTFSWDIEEVEKKHKRGAGRKTVLSTKTIGEVYDYRQSHTAKETAAFAGLSLRTFQRAEKRYKDSGEWNSNNDLYYFGT